MSHVISELLRDGQLKYPDNPLFRRLKNGVEGSTGLPDLESCLAFCFGGNDRDESEPTQESKAETINDLRCRHICVSNLRRFPTSMMIDGLEYEYFGLDFVDDNPSKDKSQPISAVVLGNNGVGKTSLYVGFEVVATGHSRIADVHGYTGPNQTEFLVHGTSVNTPLVKYFTKSEVHEYFPGCSPIVPHGFFCAVNDVERLEREDINPTYIFDEIGKVDLLSFNETLRKVLRYVQKVLEIKELEQNLKLYKKGSPEHSAIKEKIKLFKQELVAKYSINYSLYKGEIIESDLSWIKEVIDFLYKRIDEFAKQFYDIARTVVPELLKSFLNDECEIVINRDDFDVTVTLGFDDGSELSPRLYFNTFRFKLFAVAVKIALACCVKIIDKVNFPIIIDDAFDASDFRSKYQVCMFIRDIIQQHNTIEALKPYPMQLIFMTQDSIIARSVYQGLLDGEVENGVKLCRMFDFSYAEPPSDIKKAETTPTYGSTAEECEYISVADKIV